MNYQLLTNNKVYLSGKVVSMPVYSHEMYGEGFYELMLSVNRLSEQKDIIPITISERLLSEGKTSFGSEVSVKGQFRSYNKLIGDKSKLMLTVFVREFVENDWLASPNIIELTGFICKEPIYRTTPFNREIADVLLAVNRAYNKSDYIPCIAWGRNARFVKGINVGEKVFVSGRIQSREYTKKLEDGSSEVRTAYEISVGKISLDTQYSQFSDDDTAFIIDESEKLFIADFNQQKNATNN
ncbi:MAG: single-stranded DNA-binding protein [Firmicutes bacterium]|nr:single-stranded DNA-binding protein [Bacillota bacterium]